jgi:hypothetical protein
MTTSTIQSLLIFGGVLHLAILSAGITMTRVLDWRCSLAALNPLTRHIIWTHGGYVLMTIAAFGVISLALPKSLTSGAPLARCICGFIAIFWGGRLLIQMFLFDARPHLTNVALKFAYHGLTVVFIYFAVVYGFAATTARG